MRLNWLLLVSFLLAGGCAGGGAGPNSTNPVGTPSNAKGAVSINFDDGYESAYVAGLPIVEAAGFKTTQFIITKRLDTPGFLTTGQVLAMQSSGHEIGAHTRTHPHLSTLTAAQQQDEIIGSLNDLVSIGVKPVSFAYPYGDYNDTTLAIVTSAGFQDARDTKRGFNNSSSNRLLLQSYVIGPDGVDSVDTITQAIDEAQENGTWLILVFHRVDETGQMTSVTHELLQGVMDHLVEKNVRVVTIQEGLAIYGLK